MLVIIGGFVYGFVAAKKPLAAICASPFVYGRRGLLKGLKATCYPGFDNYLEGAEYTANKVEVAENFITGKGPGAAWSLALPSSRSMRVRKR